MESTPPSRRSEPRTRTKSSSRMSKLRHYRADIPQLSLEIVPYSPKLSTPSPASTLSPRLPYNLPLRELLMISPSSTKRSKKRLSDGLEKADDAFVAASGVIKRCNGINALLGCAASPRSSRKSRRRLEQEMREEREFGVGEELMAKSRKKRNGGRPKKEKSILVTSASSPRTTDGDGYNLDRIEELINDLVMWKDVSKSSLWFGFGFLCFLSSCFTKGVSFSIFSFLSQVGLLFLGVSFFSNSMRKRDANDKKRDFKLKEENIVKLGRLILPAANYSISKTREVFSGEPAMTLKVVPFLLVGAEYGHLITLWRLCALSFFIGFSCPKLYSTYSTELSKKVEYMKSWAMETWGACTHKKIVAASFVTAFWNLTAIRTRIFAAILCLVIIRYRRQNTEVKNEEDTVEKKQKQEQEQEHEQQQTQASVAIEIQSKK
ncbi:reticulon-like protein B17 [Primulina huaijiensis]|uniref:reticulon-like protein B17 n=1 Tax=Primulina huaijiensis TaxID=1492673 RepID=UPI003CC71B34